MAKPTKVSPEKVFVSFHCAESGCDESARVTVSFLISNGRPYCPECDCDMEKTHDYTEVEA